MPYYRISEIKNFFVNYISEKTCTAFCASVCASSHTFSKKVSMGAMSYFILLKTFQNFRQTRLLLNLRQMLLTINPAMQPISFLSRDFQPKEESRGGCRKQNATFEHPARKIKKYSVTRKHFHFCWV